LIVPPGSGIVH
jgi:aconitate hydratase